MTPHDDWDGLDGLWRTQAVAPPDLARLRREAAAGRRRARLLDALDMGAVAIAAGVTAHFVASAPSLGARELVPLLLCFFGALFAVWTVRNRRAGAPRDDLAPHALVDAEAARAQAARRFWRVNTRVMLALWAGVAALALAHTLGVPGLPPGRALWITSVANVPLVLASLLWARRRERTLRARLAQLEAIRRQLDA